MGSDPAGSFASQIAWAIVARTAYLTLATTDVAGDPWASPVWFAPRGLDEFVWASKPGARHSRNIAEHPRVAIVVFDSSRPPGEGSALYADADAELVDDDSGLEDALAVYNARSLGRGLASWEPSALRDGARHRLYRAVVREAFVLDDHDERVRVR